MSIRAVHWVTHSSFIGHTPKEGFVMKVLMFGWEFPPYNSGGLGTACYGLTKALSHRGTSITFVLPYDKDVSIDFMKVVPTNVTFKQIDSPLKPYISSARYRLLRDKSPSGAIYGESLFDEVYRYSQAAKLIALETDCDIIHCHDWMTFTAGVLAKQVKNKPLIVHVHSTEFDRTGGNGVNQYVYDIERYGMEQADKVIAVSQFTKNKIMHHYGIPDHKIEVVHNGVDSTSTHPAPMIKNEKIVLFLGRITLQKGPEYFLYAAKKVLDIDPQVKFIVAGSGDMEHFIMEKTAELQLSKHVLFAGFLSGEDIERAYRMADLYVMPSVSEPFGLTALEAMRSGTPVLISKQSGVSEVISHCLRADFWDIDDMANKILGVLRSSTLRHTITLHGAQEVRQCNWDVPAKKCIDIYNKLL